MDMCARTAKMALQESTRDSAHLPRTLFNRHKWAQETVERRSITLKGTADKGHLLQALGRKNREQTDENGCQADAIAG